MKAAIVLFAVLAAAQAGLIPATTLVRAPAHDSAIIQSDRLGGNFAYSSVEAPAYAAVSPVVQNVVSPVGVSYSATPVATPVVQRVSVAHASPLAYAASPLGYAASPLGYAASPLGYASPYAAHYGLY